MSDDPIDDPQDLPNTATDAPTDAAPSASDARDATIEQLERTLADERQNSAALRSTIEELNFKIGVLEQGYSKQLEDARLRTEAAEREVADHQVRMTSLDSAHEDAMQLLTKAQGELDSLTAQRYPSRKQPTSTDGSHIEAMAHDSPESGSRPIGRHQVTWDGRDDEERAVPAGTYFCRLRTPHKSQTKKLTLVR